MAQFNESASIVPITTFGPAGEFVFFPTGTLTSSLDPGNFLASMEETASFILEFTTSSRALQLRIPATSSGQTQDIIALFITSSGANPRVGIGTTNPQSTLEFLETSDTTKGSELVLAGSRTTKGAIIGDSAGILNFAIPTGSANILDSGSVGKIKGIVTNETSTGVEGKLALELFKNVNQSEDVIEFGYNLGHVSGLFNAVFTSSIELKDFTSVGYSRLSMYDFSDSLTFEVLNGDVTASGNISASGDIIATNFTATGYLTATNITASIISASDNIITNTLTASSALVENTLQFQTQSSPPTAVAGTLYLDSNYDLYIAQ